jgi:hypothetical protein
MKPALALFLVLTPFINIYAKDIDPYVFIEKFVERSNQPRLLNSEDLKIRATDPQPLIYPTGDFDKDGRLDMAISGIFDTPPDQEKYFLLVVGNIRQSQAELIEYKEYPKPVILHTAGTTGEQDPGDQAFSVTFCMGCSEGYDFYWKTDQANLISVPWKARVKKVTPISVKKESPVDPKIADEALKIAGALPEVQEFVGRLKAEKKELGTRVEPAKSDKNIVQVVIFERQAGGEKIFQRYVINVASQKVLSKSQ